MKRQELYELIERESSFEFSRSGGPGGQHGDTASTKVTLRLPLDRLPFGEEDMDRIRRRLAGMITGEDHLLIHASETRSQQENRRRAVARLTELVSSARQKPKKRRPTRPSRGAKERRLARKKHRGEIKRYRSGPPPRDE